MIIKASWGNALVSCPKHPRDLTPHASVNVDFWPLQMTLEIGR